MLLGGLWHGASWTFVVWGALHGSYLVLERLARTYVPDRPLWHTPAGRLFLGLCTFAAVCVAWVFFRAQSFSQAWDIVSAMLGGAFMPISQMPEFIKPVSVFTIVYWATDGFTKLMVFGQGVVDIVPNLVVLTAAGVIFMTMGAIILKRKIEKGIV